MDIERSKLAGLPTWLSGDALKNVRRLQQKSTLQEHNQLLRFLRQCNAYIFKGITD